MNFLKNLMVVHDHICLGHMHDQNPLLVVIIQIFLLYFNVVVRQNKIKSRQKEKILFFSCGKVVR